VQYTTLGGLAWRRARGLLTWRDEARVYRAERHPRGPYRVPMPADLIEAA
jgi:hypothetical protein